MLLTVVVEVNSSSAVTSTTPPNPSSAVVVADLYKPIVDYSEVVDIVVEWVMIEALQGPELSNDFNDLHRAIDCFNGGGMVQEPWWTVNIW